MPASETAALLTHKFPEELWADRYRAPAVENVCLHGLHLAGSISHLHLARQLAAPKRPSALAFRTSALAKR